MDQNIVLKRIVQVADDRKAERIEILKVDDFTSIADYFVIMAGNSTTQVKAVADTIEKKIKEEFQILPHHVEGYASASWILMDYGSIIVHVFLQETRQFYLLDSLWSDAQRIDLEQFIGKKEDE